MGKKESNGVLNLRIKADDKLEEKFIKIKEELGLNSNAEVVRYLIYKYYKELVGKGSLLILPVPKIIPKLVDSIGVSAEFSFLEAIDLLAGLGISF
jgi:hypothetical protein